MRPTWYALPPSVGVMLVSLGVVQAAGIQAATNRFVWPLLGMAVVACAAGLYASKASWKSPLPWILALLALPAALRLGLVGASWNVPNAGMLASSLVVGMHVWAGVALSHEEPAPPAATGAWAALVEAARQAHGALVVELGHLKVAHVAAQEILSKSAQLTTGVEKTAAMWSRMESGANDALDAHVRRQMERVQNLASGASDTAEADDYRRTHDALNSQLEAMERIRRNSARAMARAQCQVALMETARLSVMAWASQDQDAQAQESRKLATMLEEASADLALTAGALEEVSKAVG